MIIVQSPQLINSVASGDTITVKEVRILKIFQLVKILSFKQTAQML